MKRHTIILVLLFSLMDHSYSLVGDRTGNGGDTCENTIQTIKYDILDWIQNDGHHGLELPDHISKDEYKSEMIKSLSSSKVICVDRELSIGMAPKTCINTTNIEQVANYVPNLNIEFLKESDEEANFIICNKSFKSLNEEEKYILTHHEYAGVSGFETNDYDEESNYFISNQLALFLEYQFIKKLSLKKVKRKLCHIPIKTFQIFNKDRRKTELCPGDIIINPRAKKLKNLYLRVVDTSIDRENKQYLIVSPKDHPEEIFDFKGSAYLPSQSKNCAKIISQEVCINQEIHYFPSTFNISDPNHSYDTRSLYIGNMSRFNEFKDVKILEILPVKILGLRVGEKRAEFGAIIIDSDQNINFTDRLFINEGQVPGFEHLNFNKEFKSILSDNDIILLYDIKSESYVYKQGNKNGKLTVLYKREVKRRFNKSRYRKTYQSTYFNYENATEHTTFYLYSKQQAVRKLKMLAKRSLLRTCPALYFDYTEKAIENYILKDVEIKNTLYDGKWFFRAVLPGDHFDTVWSPIPMFYIVDSRFYSTGTCVKIK